MTFYLSHKINIFLSLKILFTCCWKFNPARWICNLLKHHHFVLEIIPFFINTTKHIESFFFQELLRWSILIDIFLCFLENSTQRICSKDIKRWGVFFFCNKTCSMKRNPCWKGIHVEIVKIVKNNPSKSCGI